MGWSLLLFLITKFLLEKPVKFQLIQGFYGPVHDRVSNPFYVRDH